MDITQKEWLELFEIDSFYDRQSEMELFVQWVVKDSNHIVGMYGMGGIGKTTFLTKVAIRVADEFDYIIGFSMLNMPHILKILGDCIEIVSEQPDLKIPEDITSCLLLLFHYLRIKKCLIIIDNIETVLSKERPGHFIAGYESIEQIIKFIGEANHRSCLVISGREVPRELNLSTSDAGSVRTFHLRGLDLEYCRKYLSDRGLLGTDESWGSLIERYSGNPSILRIVAATIRELYNKSIAEFLKKGVASADTFEVIGEQFGYLSDQEKLIMYWLAVEREAISLETLQENLSFVLPKDLITAMTNLLRRSLIERRGDKFTLLNVVIEYATEQLIELISTELINLKPNLSNLTALIKAESKDYIRQTQTLLILKPIIQRLQLALLDEKSTAQFLKNFLSLLREDANLRSGYITGNIINALTIINPSLSGYDFSHLSIRQAYLKGVEARDLNIAHSNISHCVFTENFGGILSVAFSSTGLMATGTFNGDIRIWSIANNEYHYLRTLVGHSDWTWKVEFSPDGRFLVSCSEDQSVRVWEPNTGTCLHIIREHESWVRSVAFSPTGSSFATASGDLTVRIWETGTGKCLRILRGHSQPPCSVAFSPDGNLFATGSYDLTIRLWDTTTWEPVRVLEGHTGRLKCVIFSPDSQLLASGANDGHVILWDVKEGKAVATLEGHKKWIRSISFNPQQQILASCCDEGTIRLWDLTTKQCYKVLAGHAGPAWTVSFTEDGKLFASGGGDQKVRIWESATTESIRILQGYSEVIWSLAFSPNAGMLVSGGDSKKIQVWNLTSGHCERKFTDHTDTIWSLGFDKTGQYLLSSSSDLSIKLWDFTTGYCIRTLTGHNGLVWSVIFSPNGSQCASGGSDQAIKIWDLTSGECVETLTGHTGEVWSVDYSPDGRFLVSGSDDQTIRVWDLDKKTCQSILRGHTNWVRSVKYSPDGSLIASSSADHTIRLWNVVTGEFSVMRGHNAWVRSAVFSPDGQILASASGDRSVRLWNTQTKACTHVLEGHTAMVRSVAFSPDGKLIASCCDASVIIVWDVETGERRLTLTEGRPYERMNITGISGLSETQIDMLKSLGAMDYDTKHENK